MQGDRAAKDEEMLPVEKNGSWHTLVPEACVRSTPKAWAHWLQLPVLCAVGRHLNLSLGKSVLPHLDTLRPWADKPVGRHKACPRTKFLCYTV